MTSPMLIRSLSLLIRISPCSFRAWCYAALHTVRRMLTIASGGFSVPCPRNAHLRFPVGSVFYSTLLPGFSAVLHQYCVYGSATLCPLSFRGLLDGQGFMTPTAASGVRAGELPWVRRTASPDAAQLHVGSVHRISGLAWSRRLDRTPTPYCWFAVRYVPRFCLILPPDTPFPTVPLSCRRCLSVR